MLGDGSAVGDNSRDNTSPDVADSCDRKGRKAAVTVEKLIALFSDATLGRLDDGITRSNDDGDALTG